jgi:hypothetical protein
MKTYKMSYQKKVIYAFNNFYLNFLTDLKKNNEDFKKIIKTHFKIFDKSSHEYFTDIRESMETNKEDIDNTNILPETTYKSIYDNVNEDEKNIINSYFIIFQIMTLIYNEEDETLLEKVLDIIKSIQNQENVDSKLEEVLYDDLSNLLCKLKEVLEPKASSSQNSSNPFEKFENTKIGSLAREISNEIDIKDLDISDPSQLLDFRNLTNSNNVLGNIISKVSNKIQNKISDGELSQTDLMNEALSLMGMMNSGGGGGDNNLFSSILNNPLFSEMLGGVGGGKKKVQVDTNKVKNLETRDRLRKKLEKRKEQSKKS